MSETELTNRILDVTKDIVLFGHESVLGEWLAYCKKRTELSPEASYSLLNSILRTMRETLGTQKVSTQISLSVRDANIVVSKSSKQFLSAELVENLKGGENNDGH
jgi:hypothetical protein